MTVPDARLAAVAALVRRGDVAADIGTDHAYLPVALIREGICPFVIASDLRVGPARVAAAHVARAGLSDKIEVRVGDGLSTLSPEEAGTIVIAGMGGETVADILDACEWIRDPRYRLVLQPMSHAERMRERLYAAGFSITEESPVIADRRFYHVCAAAYTGREAPTDPLAAYVGAMTPEQGRYWWKKQAVLLRRRAEQVPAEADELRALADRLDALCTE